MQILLKLSALANSVCFLTAPYSPDCITACKFSFQHEISKGKTKHFEIFLICHTTFSTPPPYLLTAIPSCPLYGAECEIDYFS